MNEQERLEVKRLGPDTPDLREQQKDNKQKGREFSKEYYQKHKWMTGCSDTIKVYCFPCILFGASNRQKKWSSDGYNDWGHLSEKAKMHEKCETHIGNNSSLRMYGVVNVSHQLDDQMILQRSAHNESVDKNRHVLSRIIDSIRFCGSLELALRGHDESKDSDNRGVFLTLVEDFAAGLDDVLCKHFATSTVFRGTSAMIQNEFLTIMYDVCIDRIKFEIASADFLAIISAPINWLNIMLGYFSSRRGLL